MLFEVSVCAETDEWMRYRYRCLCMSVSVCVCVRGWVGERGGGGGGRWWWVGGGHPSDACRLDNICALRPKKGPDCLMQMRPRLAATPPSGHVGHVTRETVDRLLLLLLFCIIY